MTSTRDTVETIELSDRLALRTNGYNGRRYCQILVDGALVGAVNAEPGGTYCASVTDAAGKFHGRIAFTAATAVAAVVRAAGLLR